MWRQAAAMATGLAVAAGLGLGGAGIASAATPALHIGPRSVWTVQIQTGCENVGFKLTTHTFTDVEGIGDSGTWSGGGIRLTMKWTHGPSTGAIFRGTYHPMGTTPNYNGTFSGTLSGPGGVIKGTVMGCIGLQGP
jgi:hypothetical protein